MKYLFTIFALFAALTCGAQVTTNLNFRFPVRVVNSERVDLHYLFAHWHTGADAVTNSRWVLLTGSIAEDTPSGWVVDGKTESASGLSFHQKVFVENPPRSEKQTLETLLAQKEQIENRQSKANSPQNGNPSKPRHHHTATPQNGSDTADSQGDTNVMDQESGVESPLGQLDKKLAAIPTTDSSTGAVYSVDFFVFYTGQARNGMPVLDFGLPSR